MTSFFSAGSPFGSGMFQLMSNSVRSTVVCAVMPRRVAPKWSTAGPVAVPESVAGFVMPLIVSSPSISIVSPSRVILFETKRHLGVALGVEELGGEQVGLEVLLLDLDARDLGDALQLAVDEGCLEVRHLTRERRDGVRHLEGDAGVDGVRLPRAGRDALLCLLDGAH